MFSSSNFKSINNKRLSKEHMMILLNKPNSLVVTTKISSIEDRSFAEHRQTIFFLKAIKILNMFKKELKNKY